MPRREIPDSQEEPEEETSDSNSHVGGRREALNLEGEATVLT